MTENEFFEKVRIAAGIITDDSDVTNQLKIKKNNYEYINTFALLYLFLICDLFLCNNYGIEVYI